MSSTRQKYHASLLDVLSRNGIEPLTKRKARVPYPKSNQIIDSWSHGTVSIDSAVKALMISGKLTVDITLKPKSKNKDSAAEASTYFEILHKDKKVIDEIIGEVLEWIPARRERQIILEIKANPNEETDWPRQHQLIAARLVAFRIAFSSRIAQLP
jgi:hypothetical protein